MATRTQSDLTIQPTTTEPVAKIGPNALIQTARALGDLHHGLVVQTLHDAALGDLLTNPPKHMVDEANVVALVRALTVNLGPEATSRVLSLSGAYTADYLLANRIPRPFQWVLGMVPRRTALRLLLLAVGAHAWTFAGSGTFTYDLRRDVPVLVVDSQIGPANVVRTYYAGTFRQLIHIMIDAEADVCAEQDAGGRCLTTIHFS
jgi:divinyl protochlorophyllide a 8-vinyl-reductase